MFIVVIKTKDGNGYYDGMNVVENPVYLTSEDVRGCMTKLLEYVHTDKIDSFQIF
jgi:hypothetical protein